MTNSPTRPKLTTGQLRILAHIYRFRFLTSVQIQQLMEHKDRRRINAWLRSLRDFGFISWEFNQEAGENMKPAICSLSPAGVRHLKYLDAFSSPGLSRKRRDKDSSPAFANKCLMLADITLTLAQNTEAIYDVKTGCDLEAIHPAFSFIQDLKPDLWVTRDSKAREPIFCLSCSPYHRPPA